MHVGMMQQVLSPGVQDAEEANRSTQMLRIGGDLQQGIRAGLEQKSVDFFFVLQSEWGQFMRESENHMEITDWQDFRLPSGDPAVACGGLTLRAVPVSARVIGDGLMPALGALVAMAAEGGRATTRNGVQHFDVRPVQPAPAFFQKTGEAGADNISHLKGWPVHFLTRFTLPRTVVAEETGISSSGLATAAMCLRER